MSMEVTKQTPKKMKTIPKNGNLPQQQSEVPAKLQHQIEALVASSERAEINDEFTAGKGADLAKMFRDIIKRADGERTSLVKPLNDTVKKINALFKKYIDLARTGQETIDRKILAYKQAERQRLLAIEAEQAKKHLGDIVYIPPVITEPATTYSDNGNSASVRKTWTFEVVDEAKIPRQFLTVNDAAVRAAISAGVRVIPGFKIYERETIMVK